MSHTHGINIKTCQIKFEHCSFERTGRSKLDIFEERHDICVPLLDEQFGIQRWPSKLKCMRAQDNFFQRALW